MMLKLFSVTMLICITQVLFIQAQNSEYYKDAVQLSARLVEKNFSYEIPEHLIYSIEDALIAVSHSSFLAANVVCHKYDIHSSPTTNIHNLRLIVGKEAAWSNDLSNTPVHQIFSFLTVKELEETDAYYVYDISSAKAINMKFIANELSVIDDIWMVEMPSLSKTSNNIKVAQNENGSFTIVYSLKMGSCELACNDRHYWKFEVSPGGNVQFVGEHGADLSNPEKEEKDFFSLLDEQK
jgi:hypothetical protein